MIKSQNFVEKKTKNDISSSNFFLWKEGQSFQTWEDGNNWSATKTPRVLVLGHSFIRRLCDFIERNPRDFNLTLNNGTSCHKLAGCYRAHSGKDYPTWSACRAICPPWLCYRATWHEWFIVSPSFASGFWSWGLRPPATAVIHMAFSL